MNSTIYDVTAEYVKELSKWDIRQTPKDKMCKRLRNNFDSLILRDEVRRGPIKDMKFATLMMEGLSEFYDAVIMATEKVVLSGRQEAVIEVIAHYPFPDTNLVRHLALVLIEVWKNTLMEMTPRNMNASLAATIGFVLAGVNKSLKVMPRVGRFNINVAQSLTASIAMATVWRALLTTYELKNKGDF